MISLFNKAILVTAVCTSAVILNCEAQSFSISPNDTMAGSALLENLTVFNIQQNTMLTDTLYLTWQKVSESMPLMWDASICDNGFCYTDLHNGGTMVVIPSGYGLLSLHITPHINSGTAIIRYAVWETSNPLIKDTLTWVVSSTMTGINEVPQDYFNVEVLQNKLVLKNNNEQIKTIRIVDVCGRLINEISMNERELKIDVSNYVAGIYFVQAICNTKQFTKKIIINNK